MISQETIQEATRRIVEYMQPEKVVLFGSYANGIPNEDSDLDILVITKTNLPHGKRTGTIRMKLIDFKIPLDIMVRTPDEIEYWIETPMAFTTQILKEGKVLYEQDRGTVA